MLAFKNKSSGFTLIELMITVAIVGILVAVAIPVYQSYTIKAQLAEAFLLADSYKKSFDEYYVLNGTYPSLAGYPPETLVASSGKYISSIVAVAGSQPYIVATFGPNANKKIVGLKFVFWPNPQQGYNSQGKYVYNYQNGQTQWTCGVALSGSNDNSAAFLLARYEPANCTSIFGVTP